ncbi:uncharacterized protein LOC116288902 isoform X2 [Actinia tenebrosa]|uniref:Uncharacterized protein LOC116288902 isoform X2 n=1 Tax=Actinia tenebrosa TaxID=6105 RepID=A0A6P8H5H6_ACTTE|nr:uncharacterized protein LOC116288902 isoform X2 [Actinia tenebrosa]
MAGLHISKKDGTEGTATVEMTYRKGKKKITFTIYGCIIKNDANLQKFIGNNIKQSADSEKFKNARYFFYACDPDLEEDKIIKTTLTYHRFSGKSKSCKLDSSPANLVKVQEHIFLLCDSQELDKCDLDRCKFLEKYSKKIRVAQNLRGQEEIIYVLSYEEKKQDKEDVLTFIPLKLNHQLSNVYGVDAEYLDNYKKLEDIDAGPVLLQDKETVVGSFEKRENNEISISIFGIKQDNSGSESQKVESEQEGEVVTEDQKPEPKLDKESEDKKKEEDKITPQSSSYSVEVTEDQKPDSKLDKEFEDKKIEKDKTAPQSSFYSGVMTQDQKPDSKLDEKFEDKIEEDGNGSQPEDNEQISKPKQSQEHDELFNGPSELGHGLDDQTDNKNEFPNSPPKMYHGHPTDPYEGSVYQQTTYKNDALASKDHSKLIVNGGKELLTAPLKQDDQSNSHKEKSPIQVSNCSGLSEDNIDHLEAIKSNLKDGSNQLNDDLSQKGNIKKYRRFFLYVAQHATTKWQEIGENLDVKNNKLQSLQVDYNSEGNAEQAYQMLVHWRQSDKNPTLKKLLMALIDTKLVEEANKVSVLLTENRSLGGQKVEEKLLNKITNDVKDVWKFLGRYLAIDESTIHAIKMDCHGRTREQARRMFVRWRQSNGSRATTGILINALHDVGKADVAREVQVWERQT